MIKYGAPNIRRAEETVFPSFAFRTPRSFFRRAVSGATCASIPCFTPKTKKMTKLYDCDKCPAYCCGYPIIEASKKDIRRLARHFGLDYDAAREKFTEKENNRVRKMRQRPDKKLGAPLCIFLNQKTRRCSVYHARPQICRDHPGDRCEWNDRRLLESVAGRKTIRLKVMPWHTDGDYPLYGARKLPELVHSYAEGRGKLPFPAK